MAMLQGQPPSYSEAQVITNVVGVSEPNLLALAAAQNTRLPDAVPEEQPIHMPEHDINLDSFKQKIYRHALFPLLAMVFEKCEGATSFPDSTTNGFEKDLKACMKCLEGLDKPLMDEDDDEVNQLMLKAVQVLRIHLMEVEKVNELCKDFCARYISCLKSKLTSESLLHVEGCDSPPPLDCSPPHCMMATSPTIQVQSSPVTATAAVTPTAVVGGGVMLQQQPQQPQIVSGNTVYQMVRTPQGIVAQPIQIQGPLTPLSTPPQPAIHGSTPLSQVGLTALASPSMQQQQQQQVVQQQQTSHQQQQQPQNQLSNNHQLAQQQQQNVGVVSQGVDRKLLNIGTPEDVDEEEKNGKQKRGVLPKHATQIMKSWLFQHIVHPYPTEDEKRQIASQTNLTLLQVNNWFINARRRILQPMLEVSNPDKGKVKKSSKPVTRPQHRFWPVQSDSPPNTNGHVKMEKELGGQTGDEAGSHSSSTSLSSRPGQVVPSSSVSVGGLSGNIIDTSGGGATIQSDTLMSLVQNAGLVLKVGPDGHIIPTCQVAPPAPPPPTHGSISLENLQALQSNGLLFTPGPSPLGLNLPFNGLTPAAVTGAGLAGFGMAGAFPGLAAAAAAASIMNFNPAAAAAAAAAYAPLSFANLNTAPIDLSSVSNQSTTPIHLINGVTGAAQLQMQMGLSYQGISVEQSTEGHEEGGQLHIDIENGSGMGDVGD